MAGFFAFIKGVLVLLGFMRDERLKQEGVEMQAGRDAKVAVEAERRMAEAVANAPDSKAETVESLRKGTF